METVEHDGRTTAFRLVDAGQGPTVLYVHGSGATHRAWAAQYGRSGPAHPAAAVDLSGHGESDDVDAPPGPATLQVYAADVVAVATETDADVLVGTSLGGAVVLSVAIGDGFEPGALVLAGTGAKLPVAESLRTALEDDFEAAIDFLHGENRLFHGADERLASRSKSQMRTVGRRVTRRDFLACHGFDVRDRLDEVDVPALAVCGEFDRLTPPSSHEYLAAGLPDCEYEIVPDAAHLAMIERPDAFNETVEAFLRSVEVV